MGNIHNQTLPEGTQLGVYQIRDATKIDSFQISYRAWNHHLKETVQIKEYFPCDFAVRASDGIGIAFKSPSDKENFDFGLQAFLKQTEILAQIEHPNILKAENILQFNETAYLIMPFPKGKPLSKLLGNNTAFAETELKFILLSILDMLKSVHKQGILHGDIQPETIMLSQNGEPQLTDFAGARLALASRTGKLTDSLASGYAALELYDKLREAGPPTDFYALGATLYYCITHQQPTDATYRSETLNRGEPDPIIALSRSEYTGYSEDFLEAIDWMLRPNYGNRPRTETEIVTLLNSAPTNVQEGQITAQQETEESKDTNPILKNPVWIGVIGILIGVVGVGLWLLTKPTAKKVEPVVAVQQSKLKTETSIAPEAISAKETVTAEDKKAPDISLSTPKTIQESELAEKSKSVKNEVIEPEKPALQLPPPPEEIQKSGEETSPVIEQPSNNIASENVSVPKQQTEIAPKPEPKVEPKQEAVSTPKPAPVAKTKPQPQFQPKKQKPTPASKPVPPGSVQGYLAAARRAMKDVRFTTPPGNNAYEYYQKVLAQDPNNAEALAGRQRIVDRYAWYIRKSKSDGEIARAKRVLKKAESVSPNNPKLQSIREELFGGNE